LIFKAAIDYNVFRQMETFVPILPGKKGRSPMPNEPIKNLTTTYADYLKGAIIETVSVLSDEKTLNYIYTMLMGAVTAETQTTDC
jgi:hypothetical protein